MVKCCRLLPRPNSDVEYLHGILESIARIEVQIISHMTNDSSFLHELYHSEQNGDDAYDPEQQWLLCIHFSLPAPQVSVIFT